jgi:hypothetical protein
MIYRCPHCRAEVGKSAADCGACGKPIAPVSWGRRLRGLPRWAPDRFVEDYAAAAFPVRVGLFLVLWVAVAAAGVIMFSRAQALLAEQPAMMERVRASLGEQGVPENVRDGTMHLMEGYSNLYEVLAHMGRVLVGVAVLGVLGEVTSFLMIRRLLGTRPAASS